MFADTLNSESETSIGAKQRVTGVISNMHFFAGERASGLVLGLILFFTVFGLFLAASCGGGGDDDDDNNNDNDTACDDDDDSGDDDSGDDDTGDDDSGDDDTADDDDDDTGDPGQDVWQSECMTPESHDAGWIEAISLVWDGTDLAVERSASCRDENFVLEVLYNFGCDSITVVEYNNPTDIPDGAHCLFDFAYTIEDVLGGSFNFILMGDDFGFGTYNMMEEDLILEGELPVRHEFSWQHTEPCQ